MHLDHLILYVNDAALSRDFYKAILPPYGHVVVRDFGDMAVGFGDKNYAVLALVREAEKIQTTHLAYLVRHPDGLKSMISSSVNDAFDDSEPIWFHHSQLNCDQQFGRFLCSVSATTSL